jgi:hypothetical protein
MLAGSALCAIPGFGQLKIQLCAWAYAVMRWFTLSA